MKINKVLIISMVAIVSVAMTSCFDERELDGPVVEAQLDITVLDEAGNPVSGATVDLFANRADYITFSNVTGSATTDANGVASFAKSSLRNDFMHYSVKSEISRNWSGSINKGMTNSNGVTKLEVMIDTVAVSTAISVPADNQVISTTTGVFSIADYPGTYEWSVLSGPANTIVSGGNTPEVSIAFDQIMVDEVAVLQVIATPDGFPTTTLTMNVNILAFCVYDQDLLIGDRAGDDATNWVLGTYPSQVHINGTSTPNVYEITGLGNGWMEDYWAETIQATVYVTMNISDDGLFIDIPMQDYFTTLYNGDLYLYRIVGSGSINGCSGEMTINYDMIEDGGDFSTGGWSLGAGGSTNGSPLWEAKISFTP